MDVLKNKQIKQYERLSRYATFPVYYNTLDDKYQYGTTKWLSTKTHYTLHKIRRGDTLDSIALAYYNNPTYYWVLCDFNRINDPFIELTPGVTLKIPVLSTIEFED